MNKYKERAINMELTANILSTNLNELQSKYDELEQEYNKLQSKYNIAISGLSFQGYVISDLMKKLDNLDPNGKDKL